MTSPIDFGRIYDLAQAILPGLIDEYGRWPSTEMTANYAVDYLREHGVALSDGDMELLVDEIKENAPTFTARS